VGHSSQFAERVIASEGIEGGECNAPATLTCD